MVTPPRRAGIRQLGREPIGQLVQGADLGHPDSLGRGDVGLSPGWASGRRLAWQHRRLGSWLAPERPTEYGQSVCTADNLLYPDLRPCSASDFPGKAGQKRITHVDHRLD